MTAISVFARYCVIMTKNSSGASWTSRPIFFRSDWTSCTPPALYVMPTGEGPVMYFSGNWKPLGKPAFASSSLASFTSNLELSLSASAWVSKPRTPIEKTRTDDRPAVGEPISPARSTACRSAWRTSFLANAGCSAGSTVTPMYMLSSDCPTRILTSLVPLMVAVRSGVMFTATSTSAPSTMSSGYPPRLQHERRPWRASLRSSSSPSRGWPPARPPRQRQRWWSARNSHRVVR